jgi:hypothetical protein
MSTAPSTAANSALALMWTCARVLLCRWQCAWCDAAQQQWNGHHPQPEVTHIQVSEIGTRLLAQACKQQVLHCAFYGSGYCSKSCNIHGLQCLSLTALSESAITQSVTAVRTQWECNSGARTESIGSRK